MRRTTVFLEESLQRELSALAKKQARPAAALVREAIGQYVVSQKRSTPPLSFIAVGGSGQSDTAERHEGLVFKDLSPHGQVTTSRKRKPLAGNQKLNRRRLPRR